MGVIDSTSQRTMPVIDFVPSPRTFQVNPGLSLRLPEGINVRITPPGAVQPEGAVFSGTNIQVCICVALR